MDHQMQEMIDQLRDLVRTLKGTSGIGAAGQSSQSGPSDAGINKLINALGQVASKLDGTAKTRAEEQKDMKRFTANVNRATDAQEAQTKQIAEDIAIKKEASRRAKMTADAIIEEEKRITKEKSDLLEKEKDQANKNIAEQKQRAIEDKKDQIRNFGRTQSASKQLWETYDSLGGTSTVLKNKFADLAGNSIGAQAGLQLLAAAAEGLAKSIANYTSALYKGERGATVTAKAMTDLATPLLKFVDTLGTIIQFGSMFVPGGALVKGAVFLGGTLLGLGAKTGELALKFNEIAANQADKLFKSFQEISRVGAAGARGMDDVFDTVQTLGMTVAEIEKYNTLITQNSQKFALMGTTAAQGAKAFAQVSGAIYKSNLGQQLEMLGMNDEEQRESALAYMNIQARTGQMQLKNTGQLIQETAKFAKELDLAATLTGQTRKDQAAAREAALTETRFRAALVQARQTGDEGKIQKLEAAQQAAALAKAMGDERGFRGILQYAAGGMTTPEAVAAEMTYRVSEILANPNMSQLEMAQRMGESVKLQQLQLAGSTALIGNIDVLSTDFVKTADFQQRIANLLEEANKQGFNGPDAIAKVLETEQGKRIAAGGDTKLMVEGARLQQAAAMQMDSVVNTYSGAAIIHKTATEVFSKAVATFANTVGAKSPLGGTPTIEGPVAEAKTGAATLTAVDAAQVAKETRELATVTAEQVATAIDIQKESEQEVERLKKIGASQELIYDAKQKAVRAGFETARLEEDERKLAYEARQRELEAKNKRRDQRKFENTHGAPGGYQDKMDRAVANANIETGKQKAGQGVPAAGQGSYLDKVVTVESGGRNIANNSGQGGKPTSSAFGLAQITKGTFETMSKRAGPNNPLQGKTFEDMKADTNLQMEAARQLTDSNRQALIKQGLSTTDSALYLAHFLGATGASKVLASSESTPITSVVSPEQIAANPNLQKMSTVADLKSWADKKMGGVGYSKGGIVSGPNQGYTATLHGTEAVVPLPDGKSIPVNMDNTRLINALEGLRNDLRTFMSPGTNQNLTSNDSTTTNLLSQLVDLQRRNNGATERMLQLASS